MATTVETSTRASGFLLDPPRPGRAGIGTNDLTKAQRLIPQLRAGTVWVNTYDVFYAALHVWWLQAVRLGREMGEQVIHEYTETKSICIGL